MAAWYAETFHAGRYYATNVRLGSLNPVLGTENLPEFYQKALLGSFRRLADLVVYPPPDLWIVEAKETLNWEALGQALAYTSLYEEDYLPKDHGLDVRPAVTCRTLDETVLHCADLRGVFVFHDGETVA